MKKQKKNHQIKTLFATILISISFFSLVVIFQQHSGFFGKSVLNDLRFFKYKVTRSVKTVPDIEHASAQGIPVLVYHGILNTNPDRFSTTKDIFFDQMSALKKAGYTTISPEAFISFIEKGTPVPEKSFLLTFDDGRKDSYYGADPILRFFGFQAVMFVAVHQSLDKDVSNYYLTKPELQQMVASGRWFIESHALQNDGGFISSDASNDKKSYFLSSRKWINEKARLESYDEYVSRITDEVVSSRTRIEEALGTRVTLFSYPFSDYGQNTNNEKRAQQVIGSLIKKTYPAAFRQIWPRDQEYLFNTRTDTPSLLKRFETPSTMSGEELVGIFDAGLTKQLPFKETFDSVYNWKQLWGTVLTNIDSHTLALGGNGTTNGAFTFLDGTNTWTNYVATFKSISGIGTSDLTLMARFKDTKHYIACVYSNNAVYLQEVEDGVKKEIARSHSRYDIQVPDTSFSIGVSGEAVGCFINGALAVTAQNSRHDVGGVAVAVWNIENNSVVFNDIFVEPVEDLEVYSRGQKDSAQVLVSDSEYTSASESYLHYPAYSTSVISSLVSATSTRDAAWYKRITGGSLVDATMVPLSYGVVDGTTILENELYHAEVRTLSGDSFLGWGSKQYDVVSGQEFGLTTSYRSTAPVFLIAEFKMQDGAYVQQPVQWLVGTNLKTDVYTTVVVPEGATSLQFMVILKTAGTLSLSGITVSPLTPGAFQKGMISLTLDDGFKTSIDTAYPILKKYGVTATHFVISDYLSFSRYMNQSDLQTLVAAKHEVQDHTKTHKNLTLLTLDDMQTEIVGSKSNLQEIGFKTTVFNYPYGAVNNIVRAKTISAGFSGARSAIRGFNTRYTDPFMLKDQFVGEGTSFDEVKSLIDTAIANKTWLILELHDVASRENANKDSVSPELLSKIASYIKSSGVKVVSISQGLQEMVR